ncbi:MAG TPA: hypothetical protein GYA07_16120 [Verrucomicrobia bacterium]|nr:hypothetical protein [Verrucomicrobiota bacterium]
MKNRRSPENRASGVLARIRFLSFCLCFAAHANAQWDERFGFPGGLYPTINGKVRAFAASSTGMFIGGTFDSVGGVPGTAGSLSVSNIAHWNGRGWQAVGAGLSEPLSGISVSVNAIVVQGTNVYVGGNFRRAGGILVNGIARWDGQNWHPLGTGISMEGQSMWAGALPPPAPPQPTPSLDGTAPTGLPSRTTPSCPAAS